MPSIWYYLTMEDVRSMRTLSRRQLLRLAVLLPCAGLFSRYRALAAPHLNRVKITGIRAMAIKNIAGNCLIRVDTDGGLEGYGESGATGPMARARIETMKNLLIGRDPLAIEVHFQNMTSLMHTYMAHIPTISGIDIALWDLAGKIIGAPVHTLLGGPFCDSIAMYSHGIGLNMLDKASCRDWAQRIKEMPEGFTAFKNNIDPVLGGGAPGAICSDADQRTASQRGPRLRQLPRSGRRRHRHRRALPQRVGYTQRDRGGQGGRADESPVH
jgi:L-alanine-DL-glutamate epimerase-like enolase superfamily enzyme